MPYYLDAPTLAQATAVYTNAALTTCAPNGVYSDGSVTRVQTGCVLGSAKFCPSCGFACDSQFNLEKSSAEVGVFRTTIDLGNDIGDIGAIIISFNPSTYPKGFKAVYDGITYNSFSSPIYGYMTAPTGLPVYIGDQDNDCGITTSSFIGGNYDWDGSNYTYNGTTSIISVLPSQMNLTINPPDTCIMVIPKVNLNPSSLDIIIENPCSYGFDLDVTCPIPLFPTKTSQVAITPTVVCGLEDKLTYYNYPVNGNGTTLGLYDWVFLDPYGESVVGDGYYYAPTMLPGSYDWFLTQNGVIIQMGECEYERYIIRRCATGEDFVAESSIALVIGDLVTVSDTAYFGCTFSVVGQTNAPAILTVDAISTYESCSDVCVYYIVNNMTASSHSGVYINCAGSTTSFTITPYTIEYICARAESITINTSPSGVIIQVNDCNCPS
jgi:hypothetical protein